MESITPVILWSTVNWDNFCTKSYIKTEHNEQWNPTFVNFYLDVLQLSVVSVLDE